MASVTVSCPADLSVVQTSSDLIPKVGDLVSLTINTAIANNSVMTGVGVTS